VTSAQSSVREALAATGPLLLATFVLVPRVEVVELLAYAGFDAVILDLEHGPYGIESLSPLVAASHAAGTAALVRVADERPQSIGAALDVGADGVIVPHVKSGPAAAAVVRAARFAPEGERGANPYVRAARYSSDTGFIGTANRNAASIAMVEGKEGLQAIDAILDVEGLDAVFLGPVDISMSLGVPGQPEHPRVVDALAAIVERARGRGVATGVFAPTVEAAARWATLGVRLVALGVDTALMLNGFAGAVEAFRSGRDERARRA
jgi:2-keto-3-deoxy-L-rhamnonate aldolase RhmA